MGTVFTGVIARLAWGIFITGPAPARSPGEVVNPDDVASIADGASVESTQSKEKGRVRSVAEVVK